MSDNTRNDKLLQLKIDYIQFLMQNHKALGYDINFIGVIFALLMEKDYLTVYQLVEMTQLSRSSIVQTLQELTQPNSKFPVLKTRKKNDTKQYYYCPLELREYLKELIGYGLGILELSISHIPNFIYRLERIEPKTAYLNHIKEFFIFFYTLFKYYALLTKSFHAIFEITPENQNFYSDYFDKNIKDIKIDMVESNGNIPESDSLHKIKKDFIKTLQSLRESTKPIGKTNLPIAPISVIYSLWLEIEPMTQKALMEATDYGRSTISEVLTGLVRQGIVKTQKNMKTKEKHFQLKIALDDFVRLRLKGVAQTYNQVVTMNEKRFLPDLQKIKIPSTEKNKIEYFIQSIGNVFKLGEKHIEAMYISFEKFKGQIKNVDEIN